MSRIKRNILWYAAGLCTILYMAATNPAAHTVSNSVSSDINNREKPMFLAAEIPNYFRTGSGQSVYPS
jgi:hypothetical protein